MSYKLGGEDSDGSSNVNLRMTDNGTLVYAYNSPDNRDDNILYKLNFSDFSTLRSHDEKFKATGIFDEFLDDPSCDAVLDY